MKHAIQIESEHTSLTEAMDVLLMEDSQQGHLFSRFHYRPKFVPVAFGKMAEVPCWRVLAYQEADGTETGWLPDGCRLVILAGKYA